MRLLSRSGAVFRSVSFSIRHGVKSTLPLLGDLVHIFFVSPIVGHFVHVCLCDCLSASMSLELYVQIFVHVTYGRGSSVFLWGGEDSEYIGL